MDFKKIKEKFSKMSEKYQGKIDSHLNSKAYHEINDGLRLVEEVKELVDDLSQKVERGNVAVKGALALTRQRIGTLIEGDKKSLEGLRTVYDGERGRIGRFVSRVTGNRHPPLKKALEMIGEVTEQIPPYVDRLSTELNNRREELTGFKDYLRKNIEGLIESRGPLENDIYQLDDLVKSLEAEYNTLEQQRLENSSKGIRTEPELITRLGMLESVVSEAREKYSELDSRKQHLQGNIDLVNNQIGKINQLMGLLHQSQDIVYRAKDFVDIQVPYVINEIRNQGSQIHSLAGIDRTVEFLDRQREVSARINDRIKLAADYLDKRVEEVRENAIASQSIYSLPGDSQEKIVDATAQPVAVLEYVGNGNGRDSGDGNSALDRYLSRFHKEE